jgi:acetyl esterase/lipase
MMVLLFDAGEPDATGHAEFICRSVAHAPGILSLSAACRRGHELEDGVRSIEWTADHAAELGAQGAGLVLAGLHGGAAVAAALAIRARDDGWPEVIHQLLIHPRFGAAAPTTRLSGAAPATLIGGDEGSRAYAIRLRRAAVPVKRLRHGDPFSGPSARPAVADRLLRDVAGRLTDVVRASSDSGP